MKPYYQDDLVTLYHGDCLEVTDWLEADVLVTDPPYGQKYNGNFNRGNRIEFHKPIAGDDTTEARDKALSQWGKKSALVFGTWKTPKPADVLQVIVWDKTPCGFLGDLDLPWGNAHEEIYVLGKGAWTGKREPSVINAQMLMSGDKERPKHPTPKPIGLMEKLVSKTIGVIADPFAGSGATLIAARNLGRISIGVEYEEKYCELIATRLSQQAFDLEGLTA